VSVKWDSQAVKTAVVNELVSNAEIAGKFIESDARRRLQTVMEPDWGSGHRKYISALLTYAVEREPSAVVIRVGLPPGKKRKDGSTTRHLGYYIEMGSRTAPAHPFLRPALHQNLSKILALLVGR
jgi:hypothetical protein